MSGPISPGLLLRTATATARRFPFPLAAGALTASAGFAMLGESVVENGDTDRWIRLMAAAGLGIPLFSWVGIALSGVGSATRWIVSGVLAGLLALFYLATDGWTDEGLGIRVTHLAVFAHLLIAAGPGLRRPETLGLWHFNKRLFTRFVLGGFYAGVLFGGLSAALAALDNLFGVSIPEETYGRLFFGLAFVFHPWFTLSGVPEDPEDADGDYPAFVRVFAQYVLIPLVCLYFVILTAYLVRVVALSDWPSGWIGYLAAALALAGILSIVLVHPVRQRPGGEWVRRYAFWFWAAILPQTGMLAAAIWQRVDQYGLTESRYFLALGTLWLAGAAVFVLARRPTGVRWIPRSLCLVALASFVGPWSAYDVSRRSQVQRLESLAEESGGLVDGRLVPVEEPVSREYGDEVEEIVRHLVARHGTGAVDPWFEGGVQSLMAEGEPLPVRGREAGRIADAVRDHVAPPPPGFWDSVVSALDALGSLFGGDRPATEGDRPATEDPPAPDGPPTEFVVHSEAWSDALTVAALAGGAGGAEDAGDPASDAGGETARPAAVQVLADADLLAGSYAVGGARIEFESGPALELTIVWDGTRYRGSYVHILEATFAHPDWPGDDGAVYALPRDVMAVEFRPRETSASSGRRARVFVSRMSVDEDGLETARGLVVLLDRPDDAPR